MMEKVLLKGDGVASLLPAWLDDRDEMNDYARRRMSYQLIRLKTGRDDRNVIDPLSDGFTLLSGRRYSRR
jgi:hypothetical protein